MSFQPSQAEESLVPPVSEVALVRTWRDQGFQALFSAHDFILSSTGSHSLSLPFAAPALQVLHSFNSQFRGLKRTNSA